MITNGSVQWSAEVVSRFQRKQYISQPRPRRHEECCVFIVVHENNSFSSPYGPRHAKKCLWACAKRADSHHAAHVQVLILAFALHWVNNSGSRQRRPWSECAEECASAHSDLGLRSPPMFRRHIFARWAQMKKHIKKTGRINGLPFGNWRKKMKTEEKKKWKYLFLIYSCNSGDSLKPPTMRMVSAPLHSGLFIRVSMWSPILFMARSKNLKQISFLTRSLSPIQSACPVSVTKESYHEERELTCIHSCR